MRERLDPNGWNRTRTAADLGIARRCPFNKIVRHGLAPSGQGSVRAMSVMPKIRQFPSRLSPARSRR